MKMKKIFAMLMLAGAVAVVATSCKKDEDTSFALSGAYEGSVDLTITGAISLDSVPVTFNIYENGGATYLSADISTPLMTIPVSIELQGVAHYSNTPLLGGLATLNDGFGFNMKNTTISVDQFGVFNLSGSEVVTIGSTNYAGLAGVATAFGATSTGASLNITGTVTMGANTLPVSITIDGTKK